MIFIRDTTILKSLGFDILVKKTNFTEINKPFKGIISL